MFEPLANKIGDAAVTLDQRLARVEDNLTRIVENTRAEVEYDEFITVSGRGRVGADETATIELLANEGFSWNIFRLALTSSETGNAAAYVGAVAPDNLIGVYKEPNIYAAEEEFFIPRGVTLTVHFYEQEEGHTCTVNMQARQVAPSRPRTADTGRSREAYDHPRVEPVPSGSPLDTISIQ